MKWQKNTQRHSINVQTKADFLDKNRKEQDGNKADEAYIIIRMMQNEQ